MSDEESRSEAVYDQSEGIIRYPGRLFHGPSKWYIGSSIRSMSEVMVSNSFEPTLKEAMYASLEKKKLWHSAIDEKLGSLISKNKWFHDDKQDSKPLPTYIILKAK